MTINTLNKMASGRNLLCRPRQGGHGSHGQETTQKDFVLSFEFLESPEQTPKEISSGLFGRSALSGEVSLHPGNRYRVWRRQHRRPSPVSDSLAQESPKTSRRKSTPDCKIADFSGASFDYRRYPLSSGRQENRRFWHSSRSRRFYPWPLCRHQYSQNRNPASCLGHPGLPAQKDFSEGGFQKQSPDCHRNPYRSHSNLPRQAHRLDGCLVYLRSYSQPYYSGRVELSCRHQTKPHRRSE